MDLKLNNKVALVLASSKGLGKAIATTLAQEGATVVIASRSAEELNKTADEISRETGSSVIAIAANVSSTADTENLINKVAAQFGLIDILINNAGGPPFAAFEQFDDEQWQKAFELNLLSFARLSRLALPHMKKTGSGRIINIISGSVKSVLANSVLSTSMRMGVVGMAKMMADELGPYNITVNNVAPGLILTDRIKHTLPADVDPDEAMKERATSIPLRALGNRTNWLHWWPSWCRSRDHIFRAQPYRLMVGQAAVFINRRPIVACGNLCASLCTPAAPVRRIC